MIDIDEFTKKQEYTFLTNTSTKERLKMIVPILRNSRLRRAVSSVCSVDWRKLLICSVLGLSGHAAWAGLLDKIGQFVTDDYLWNFKAVYGPGVDLIDVRWRWGVYALNREVPVPTWSQANVTSKPINQGGASLTGPFPDKDLHVEWVSSSGDFHVVDIPLKDLLTKSNITYQMQPQIKLWFLSSDEVSIKVELGPKGGNKVVDLYSSKKGKVDLKQATVKVSWWTINFEIPPKLDTRTFNIRWNLFEEGPNEGMSSKVLKESGIVNLTGHPVRAGRYRIFYPEKARNLIKVEWISPLSGALVKKEIPVLESIEKAKIALPSTTTNLFNYSHELLIRITADDNAELVFGPKAEYADVVKSDTIIIYSTAPAANLP